MSSDDRLALRAARGDQRAFEEIYSRYHQDLYRFCLAMVGNTQDAQDALQNTMVKVLRALPGEKRKIQLKPWLYRIARNESIETLRRRRDSVELEPEQATAAAVAETAESRERLRTLLADLEQLPARQRAALVMRELSGLDFAEIGAAFGSSAAVARQTLYEARLSLRQLEAGREMRCADVMRELSDADGRVTRRREIRAHLRTCADCRAFREEIARRHEDLAALAPLPLVAAAGLLNGALASGAGGAAAGGLAGTVGVGAGKVVATSTIVKSAATVAVVAVAGVSAADRGGVIDLPLPGKDENAAVKGVAEPAASTGGEQASGGADPVPVEADARQKQTAGDGGTGGQGKNDGSGASEGSERVKNDSVPGDSSSRSQAGQSPPGGGYGRSASNRRGRPEHLPEAAAHGQQTAGAHKPDHAAAPPGQSTSGGNSGKSSGGGGSEANSAPPAQAQAPQPPVGAPPQAKGGPAEPVRGPAPPELEG